MSDKQEQAKQLLKKIAMYGRLSADDASALFDSFVSNDGDGQQATDAQLGAYLFSTGLRDISQEELTGAATSLRKLMTPIDLSELASPDNIIDTCGTGGSGVDSFNTSTACALIVAAAGQLVAKHGNRAASSRSGSADVLKALGISLECGMEQLRLCAKETNFCFLFAPLYHPATKRAVQIRKELSVRTIFNYLGPLLNPAGAKLQLMGVSQAKMLEPIAHALQQLGTKRALVVRGKDGLDEITLTGPTIAYSVTKDRVEQITLTPEQFGLRTVSFDQVKGMEPDKAASKIRSIFNGEVGPYRDLLVLNAGAALYVAGRSGSIEEGMLLATQTIDSGKAKENLGRILRICGDHALQA